MIDGKYIYQIVGMLLCSFVIGRKTAGYKSIWRVRLPKWARITLFIVDINIPTINTMAIIWQIPITLISALFVLKICKIDMILLLSGFSLYYPAILALYMLIFGSILVIYTVFCEIFMKKK